MAPQNTQWELAYPGTTLLLGSSPLTPAYLQRGIHLMAAPEVSEAPITDEDTDNERGDGIQFGQDFRGGTIITFDVGLRGNSIDDVETLRGDLLRAWRGDAVRDTPGDLATLCTSRSGLLRMVYGRPRLASAAHTKPRSAFMPGTLTFKTVNDLWYDFVPGSLVMGLVPPPTGGVTFPELWPIVFTKTSDVRDSFRTGGNTDTQPWVTFKGPINNPSVEVVGAFTWTLGYNIPAGVTVTLDARPWALTALLSTGGSVAGKMSRTSRLSKGILKPNTTYTVAFRGTDPTGTSSMTLGWHNAYASN